MSAFANYMKLSRLTKSRTNTEMMCYKDRAWCSVSLSGCGNKLCDRNFTGEERQKAIQWWGGTDFPIASGDFKTDGCGYLPIQSGNELLEELD